MKKIIIGLLFASGSLFAQKSILVEKDIIVPTGWNFLNFSRGKISQVNYADSCSLNVALDSENDRRLAAGRKIVFKSTHNDLRCGSSNEGHSCTYSTIFKIDHPVLKNITCVNVFYEDDAYNGYPMTSEQIQESFGEYLKLHSNPIDI